MKQPNF